MSSCILCTHAKFKSYENKEHHINGTSGGYEGISNSQCSDADGGEIPEEEAEAITRNSTEPWMVEAVEGYEERKRG